MACIASSLVACGLRKQTSETDTSLKPVGPMFIADSAYQFCQQQCDFGPRTMNSAAHDACGNWIVNKFQQYGMTVTRQEATLKGYDGTPLKSMNIIASYLPEQTARLLLCAHWDSRPWADNDPDEVMLEIARLLQNDSLQIGVDFVCFDAEDWGVPQWSDVADRGDSWALGAQYWAEQCPKRQAKLYRFGILLDMVGGEGAQFYKEGMSMQHAAGIVDKVWQAAQVVGYGSRFPMQTGGYITDDHIPVNKVAKIPCIDIIPHYPDCEQSNFGPTWHTVNDTMDHIDKSTLQAVGQTVIQVLFSEK